MTPTDERLADDIELGIAMLLKVCNEFAFNYATEDELDEAQADLRRAISSELASRRAAETGFVLVPLTPTREILEALAAHVFPAPGRITTLQRAANAYRAILASRPTT